MTCPLTQAPCFHHDSTPYPRSCVWRLNGNCPEPLNHEGIERWEDRDIMLYVSQKGRPKEQRRSFRCEVCRSNVFRMSLDVRCHYRCNGCGATYTGEEYDKEE